MSILSDLVKSNKSWAAKRAQMALDLETAFRNEEISADEYKELLEDLVRTDTLEAESDDIQTKAMLIQGINALAKLA
jgi:hypothetical protein